MSSILDALRKLEEADARPGGGAVLRRERRWILPLSAAGVVVAFGAGVGTALWVRGGRTPVPVETAALAPPVPAPAPAPADIPAPREPAAPAAIDTESPRARIADLRPAVQAPHAEPTPAVATVPEPAASAAPIAAPAVAATPPVAPAIEVAAPPPARPPRAEVVDRPPRAKAPEAPVRSTEPPTALARTTEPVEPQPPPVIEDIVPTRPPAGAPPVVINFLVFSRVTERRSVTLTIGNAGMVTLHEGEAAADVEVARILADRVHLRFAGVLYAVKAVP